MPPQKRTAPKTPSQALLSKSTPFVVALCTTQSCDKFDEEQTVPAGIVVAPGVIMNGTLSCMYCGSHLTVTGKAEDSED